MLRRQRSWPPTSAPDRCSLAAAPDECFMRDEVECTMRLVRERRWPSCLQGGTHDNCEPFRVTDPQPRRLTHHHRLATSRARVPTNMRFQSHCDVSLAKRIQIGVTPACASFASRSFSIARSRRAVGPPGAAIGPLRLSRLPNAPEDRGVRPLFSRRRSSWL